MQDPAVPNEGKDVFDWVKEDNLTRLRECLQTKIRLVNEPDAEGMTLLHWACDRGHQQAVSLLLDYGADVNLQVCTFLCRTFPKMLLHIAPLQDHCALLFLLILRIDTI